MCVHQSVHCDLLLKLLYIHNFESFLQSSYLISSWWLQELMINFALNLLYEEVIPLTFPSTKFVILFVDIQNKLSYNVVLGRCECGLRENLEYTRPVLCAILLTF